MLITELLVGVLIFIISSLPLYFAVKFLGGKTTLLKTVLVVLVGGLAVSAVRARFAIWGGLIAFLVLVWVYHEVFRLRWWKAFLLWLVHLLIIALFYVIVLMLSLLVFGIALRIQ